MSEKITIGFCKDCVHRDKWPDCENEHFKQGEYIEETGNEISYSYNESGCFAVGDNFGCVHFKDKV